MKMLDRSVPAILAILAILGPAERPARQLARYDESRARRDRQFARVVILPERRHVASHRQ